MAGETTNGKYRNTLVTLKRNVTGMKTEVFSYSILSAFTASGNSQPAVTSNQLALMTDAEFSSRASIFQNFLKSLYPDDDWSWIGSASGTDTSMCPITGSEVQPTSFNVSTPALSNHEKGSVTEVPITSITPSNATDRSLTFVSAMRLSPSSNITSRFNFGLKDNNTIMLYNNEDQLNLGAVRFTFKMGASVQKTFDITY